MEVSRIFLLSVVCFVSVICLACSSDSSEPQPNDQGSAERTAIAPPPSAPTATSNQIDQNSKQAVTKSDALTGKAGESKGYLTTPKELAVIQAKADQGIEPYRSAVKDVLAWAKKDWNFSLDSVHNCPDANTPAWIDNQGGVPILYAKALAYHLTGKVQYAQDVKNILQRIMTEVLQISTDEQQCRLNFSWGTPELVASADLIEHYWYKQSCTGPVSTVYADTTIDSGNCKKLFQNWLVKNPYYLVSYTAEGAQSNWGASSTNTLAYIADYLWDRPDVVLVHRVGDPQSQDKIEMLSLSPAEAYARANKLMFERMNGYGIEYFSNKSCSYLGGDQQSNQWMPVKSQITEKGIIPEDARRQEFCNIPQYNGEYQNYPQLHLGSNIQQCELMLRRGDSACYDNVDNSDIPNYSYVYSDGTTKVTHLYPGRGSIERAIDAIIIDSHTEWRHDSALAVAYRYYYNHHRLPGIEQWPSQIDKVDDCAQDICFGVLTHGFAADEQPELPPVVPPEQ
jgi:hypothetical protein